MEADRGKRKFEGEEDSEEQKMEKFFALIRSTKDARDRLSKVEQQKEKGVWNPTFQPQDFIDRQDLGKTTHFPTPPLTEHNPPEPTAEVPPPAPHNEDERKASEGDNLDLTLSL